MRNIRDIWRTWNFAGSIGKYGIQPGTPPMPDESRVETVVIGSILDIHKTDGNTLTVYDKDIPEPTAACSIAAWNDFMQWYDEIDSSPSFTFTFDTVTDDNPYCAMMIRKVDIVSYEIRLGDVHK